MNPHPIGTFARLAFARGRRARPCRSAELQAQDACIGSCVHVPVEVWTALDRAYPDSPLEGPACRRALAALFAPLMAAGRWRFCWCYRAGRPEHRFIQHLVDTGAANLAAGLLVAEAGRS